MSALSRRDLLGITGGGLSAVGLAACAPGGGDGSGNPVPGTSAAGAPVSAIPTDGTKLGNVSITCMDTWTDNTSLQAKWAVAVQAAFKAKYPNITIKRVSSTFDEINKTLKLKLSDPSAPDVVPANNGWQGIGTLAKAGLIHNLDNYAKAFGWDKRLPETIAKQHQVTADGKHIGTGAFFGMPIAQGGFITIYYNRAKLAKLGGVPTTFDAFTASLAAAKQAGEVPMMIGTQDQWLSCTTLFAMMASYANLDKIGNFVYGISGSAADTGMGPAAKLYQQWAHSGYLAPNFAGTSSGDSGTKFVDGQGVYYFYYSDSLPITTPELAAKFGTFLLPPTSAVTGGLQAVGASNQNLSIATNSKQPNAAAVYLDFISSKEAGDVAIKNGLMPFNQTYETPADAAPLLKDELGELDAVSKTDGFVPYFDWSSPTMLDTLGAQTQQLLAGKITPDQLVAACQKDYDAFKKSQG